MKLWIDFFKKFTSPHHLSVKPFHFLAPWFSYDSSSDCSSRFSLELFVEILAGFLVGHLAAKLPTNFFVGLLVVILVQFLLESKSTLDASTHLSSALWSQLCLRSWCEALSLKFPEPYYVEISFCACSEKFGTTFLILQLIQYYLDSSLQRHTTDSLNIEIILG